MMVNCAFMTMMMTTRVSIKGGRGGREDEDEDDDHHQDEYDDDLLSLSMSLPSSFACFNFLSIALLIFCN